MTQRRLTFTAGNKFPGVATSPRHWLRAAPDGYTYVAIDNEGYSLGRYFSAHGIMVVVLKSRLPDGDASKPALPFPPQDALAAVQLVREHAAA